MDLRAFSKPGLRDRCRKLIRGEITMGKIIIHESIKEGTSSQNCSLCSNWGADIQTKNGVRKARGYTRKSGQVVKECKIHGHLAVPSCVCSFYS